MVEIWALSKGKESVDKAELRKGIRWRMFMIASLSLSKSYDLLGSQSVQVQKIDAGIRSPPQTNPFSDVERKLCVTVRWASRIRRLKRISKGLR
jgi:hypothetical protein